MGHIVPWTDFEISELKRLYVTLFDGVYLSHRSIGNQIGKTRNAIIGKIHRLKLHRDAKVPVQGNDYRVRQTVATRGARYSVRPVERATEAATSPPVRSVTAISILEANDAVCRFPIGHVGAEDFHLCGAATSKAPYCTVHSLLCFRPLVERKRTIRPTYRAAWVR